MTAKEYITKFGVHCYDGELYNKDDNCVEIENDTLEDLACHGCGSRYDLRVVTSTWARIGNDGHECECECEYEQDALTECHNCGENHPFKEFQIHGLDAALQKLKDDGDDAKEEDEEEDPPPPPAVTIDELSPPPEPQSEPIGWDTDGINNQQTNT